MIENHGGVTLGVVIYNTHLALVRKLSRSLKNSEYPLKVVFLCNSDDQSYNDSLQEVCALYNFEFLPMEPNRGFGAGHNRIASSYASDWYVCCNPDIEIESTTIKNLLAFAAEKSDSILLAPQIKEANGDIQKLSRPKLTPLSLVWRYASQFLPEGLRSFEYRFDYSKSSKIEFVSGCFFAVKAENFSKLEGFDENIFLYAEDADLSLRALEIGSNYYVSNAVVRHEWMSRKQRKLSSMLTQFKSQLYYFRKHSLWIA